MLVLPCRMLLLPSGEEPLHLSEIADECLWKTSKGKGPTKAEATLLTDELKG